MELQMELQQVTAEFLGHVPSDGVNLMYPSVVMGNCHVAGLDCEPLRAWCGPDAAGPW